MLRMLLMVLATAFLTYQPYPAIAIDLPSGFEDNEVFPSLAEPSAVEFAPDGRMFIAERVQGRLRVAIQDSAGAWSLEPTPFYTFDIPADANGTPVRHRSSGLRDFAFDPDFANNGYIYAYYMKNQPRQNRVVRITASPANPNLALANSEVLLLDLPSNSTEASGSHVGGAVEFGSDGKLYVSTGDGWNGGNPVQSLSTYTGKVFRINTDGSIPSDNPFFNQASGNYRAIYALGFRNPFTMARHPTSGDLYVNDVVGSGKADLFRLAPGLNAGYPSTSSIGVQTNEWADAGSQSGYVVAGGDWCPSTAAFPAAYQGRYFLAFWGSNSSPSGMIQTLQSESNTTVAPFANDVFALSTGCGGSLTVKPAIIRFGPDGRLYYVLTHYETPCGALRCIRWLGAAPLAAPGIAPAAGWYPTPTTVTLTLAGPGEIRYTTNGSDPTMSSTLYVGPFTIAQNTLLKARGFSTTGTSGPIATAQYVIGARIPDPVANPATGLSYAYYEGTWTALPDLAAMTPLAMGWVDQFDLSVRQRDDDFAIRFTGYVEVPTDGAYTFDLDSDDGSRLWIGNTLVVDNDHTGSFQVASGTIGLAAGLHSIAVSYFDHSGPQGLSISYAGPGIANTSIPASALFRDANQPPTADAGPDLMVLTNRLVELDGTQSSDPETSTQALTWNWTQLGGPAVTLQQTSDLVARFTPSLAGNYTFQLEVSDGEFMDTDSVVVSVVDPPSGLIRYWRLDEGSGGVIIDDVTGQPGTLVGPAWQNNGMGAALSFDGSNDRVDIGPITTVGGSGFSVACWFRADDFGQSDGRLISRATTVDALDHIFMLSTVSETALRFRLRAGGLTTTLASSTGVISAGIWHHVVGTYDGANMVLYRDGQEIASTAKTGAVDTDPAVPVALGNQPAGAGSRPFDGLIDEVRIYDRGLSASEVAALAGCSPGSADCNANGISDACDIASDPSIDCDQNGLPDECDIASDPDADANGNGILDLCEPEQFVRGDIFVDGTLNLADYVTLLNYLFTTAVTSISCEVAADVDGNGVLNLVDVVYIGYYLFANGAPPVAPFPNCGLNPTGVPDLGCSSYPACP